MINRATKTIVVADSSKFGVRGFGRICGFDDIDMLITDSGAPKPMIEMIEDAGVEVLIVE
jgi:DeoR family transcriptional regulator of aga operon